MPTQLHSDVKNLAGNKPALVFSFEALKAILITNFNNATNYMQGKSVAMDGYPNIEAMLSGLSAADLDLGLVNSKGIVSLVLQNPFTATITIHHSGDPTKIFSTITIEILTLSSQLSVIAPNLLIGTPDPTLASKIILDGNRDANIASSGIDPEDVSRVEGSLAYVMPKKLITTIFNTIDKIDLTELFTAFSLNGPWYLSQVTDGIVIIPADGIIIKQNLGCPLNDSVPSLSLVSQTKQQVGGSYSWPLSVSGINPAIPGKRINDKKNGFASIYLPKQILDERFGNAMPGVNYVENGNAFLGNDLSIYVSFQNIGLRIDENRYGFVIDLDLIVNGKVALYVDVPCFGKCTVANVDIDIDTSKLSILVSFKYSTTAKLTLNSQVDNLQIGNINVAFSFFAQWLVLFAGGQGAIEGFVLDKILDRIIGNILPSKIEQEIKDNINSKNIQLLDIAKLGQFAQFSHDFKTVTYSGDNDSILVGLLSDD